MAGAQFGGGHAGYRREVADRPDLVRQSGNFHSNALHVVERYTPRSPGTLMYEATIEDPNTFSRPSTIRVPLYRRVEENAELIEFKCPEFAEEVLYGHLRRQPVD